MAEEGLTPAERAARLEKEEDEYFESMIKAFSNGRPEDETIEDDIEYFQNHPLFCKEITPKMLEDNPEILAMQNLAYEGTPEEVAKNF